MDEASRRDQFETKMLNPKPETPAFAGAPARRTGLWQAGLRAGPEPHWYRAGRLNSK
jgi:hypothetical protein